MADRETNTGTGELIAAPFGMPRVNVPDEMTINDRGHVVFTLHSDRGPVSVETYGYMWECRGTSAALIASGLLRPEWCPGLPGNNKTQQPVFFDGNKPRLHVGQRGGPKYAGAFIEIIKCSANRFVVKIPVSAEHGKRIEVLQEQRNARIKSEWQADHDKAVEARRIARLKRETPADVRVELVDIVTVVERLLSSRLGDCRFRYAEGALAEVNRHIEVVKQVLMTSALIPIQSNPRRDGNVVYLHGHDYAREPAATALH